MKCSLFPKNRFFQALLEETIDSWYEEKFNFPKIACCIFFGNVYVCRFWKGGPGFFYRQIQQRRDSTKAEEKKRKFNLLLPHTLVANIVNIKYTRMWVCVFINIWREKEAKNPCTSWQGEQNWFVVDGAVKTEEMLICVKCLHLHAKTYINLKRAAKE